MFITTNEDLTTTEKVPSLLYLNNGDETFTDISVAAGIQDSAWGSSASFGDYNKDGWLDIYVAHYIEETGASTDSTGFITFSHIGYSNSLFLNNGDLTFTDVAGITNVVDTGTTLASTFTDYDNDGDVDIYVANDFGFDLTKNGLYQNQYPNDSFTNLATATNSNLGIFSMGIAVGDYDENGTLDYYITNIGRNVLLQNQSNFSFLDVATSAGVENQFVDTLNTTSWGTGFFDYDNDTYLDLFVSNGYIETAPQFATHPYDPNKLYRNNNADGTFTDLQSTAGIGDTTIGRGSAFADYDNDGDLDLLQGVLEEDTVNTSTHALLYQNNGSNTGNWLKIKLNGTISNKDAFGARIELKVDNRTFLREVGGGSSHASQNTSIAHFGMGTYTQADSIIIYWPMGDTSIITNINTNQYIEITEVDPNLSTEEISLDNFTFKAYPNPAKDKIILQYRLDKEAKIQLTIFDNTGLLVTTLVNKPQNKGEKNMIWNVSEHLNSGIYFAKINVDGVFIKSLKMVVVK